MTWYIRLPPPSTSICTRLAPAGREAAVEGDQVNHVGVGLVDGDFLGQLVVQADPDRGRALGLPACSLASSSALSERMVAWVVLQVPQLSLPWIR